MFISNPNLMFIYNYHRWQVSRELVKCEMRTSSENRVSFKIYKNNLCINVVTEWLTLAKESLLNKYLQTLSIFHIFFFVFLNPHIFPSFYTSFLWSQIFNCDCIPHSFCNRHFVYIYLTMNGNGDRVVVPPLCIEA